MSHVELQPGFDFQQAGKEVLAIERECLAELDQYINQNFTLACEKMFWCKGKVVVMGMGGKAPGRYNLHLGGNRIGTRIPRMYKENITEPEILASLDELIGRWAKEREVGEGFGDFTVRAGIIRPVLDPARDLWD